MVIKTCTVEEAMRILGCNRHTIDREVAHGRIHRVGKIGMQVQLLITDVRALCGTIVVVCRKYHKVHDDWEV